MFYIILISVIMLALLLEKTYFYYIQYCLDHLIRDRPILIFVITDTDNLYVYVPDNRYSEPIFITVIK